MSAFVVSTDHIDLLVTRMIGAGRSDDHVRVFPPDRVGAQPLSGWDSFPPELLHQSAWGSYLIVDHQCADQVGRLLLEENIASVWARYPGDESIDTLPGPRPMPRPADYTWRAAGWELPPIQVIAAIHGYRYQSCEHRGWEGSLSKALVDALEQQMIQQVPGYSSAETWHYTRPVGQPEVVSLTALMNQNRNGG